ncbi:unnamed protein product, partial [Rotaria sp. Silwood2]
MKYLFSLVLLHSIFGSPQINLHYTDWVSESESNNALQHDYLRVTISIDKAHLSREIISYCMNELLAKVQIENKDIFPKFTFCELSKQNITSQQLYYWSAPMDVVERYQFYLNQLSTSNDKSLETQVFYNCTFPRFGSMCQDEITYNHKNYSSLHEVIHDYYKPNDYNAIHRTCYTHWQCNRGPFPACLDWREICDGKVDCIDGKFDEEHCWELEINTCKDDEYRCMNGQCIPLSFFRDDVNTTDCLDNSDDYSVKNNEDHVYMYDEPSFRNEENTYKFTQYQYFWMQERDSFIFKAMHLAEDYTMRKQCLSALRSILKIPNYEETIFIKTCEQRNFSFQTICDGFTELISILIEEKNETECEQWPCNNIYTHCDGLWNCLNGENEIGCYLISTLNCSSDHHLCVSPDTNQLMCLSAKKINDNKIDCLGATDEPTLCQKRLGGQYLSGFYCTNQSFHPCVSQIELCDRRESCTHRDDEQFCEKNRTNTYFYRSICFPELLSIRSEVEHFLCQTAQNKWKQPIKYFSLDERGKSVTDQTKIDTKVDFPTLNLMKTFQKYQRRCHRGFDLRVWLNNEKNLTRNTCLCPPTFYGDQCQYKNQRVSLTIQFQALSDSWSTLFAIIVSLVDDSEERIIHSYEQFTYLSTRDSYIVTIPRNNENIQICSSSQCIHGKCIIYSNNPQNNIFCQCNLGWSGRYCTIPHDCICSSDSICIGLSAHNRSICVCSVHKFGYQCLLVNTICQLNNNSTCLNGGQCIPVDEYMSSNQKFTCICSKGYTGDQCEKVDNKIILSFNKDIILSPSIFIHFIEVINDVTPRRMTTFRTIPLLQDLIILYWSRPFHLVFIEVYNKIYYLAVIQKTYTRSTTIATSIKSSDRCQHINELFNESFVQMHRLRRIKYYHLPCQRNSSNLACFYDNVSICLCYNYDKQRIANCFDFNHDMKSDCLGQSVCENDGQCFQDTPYCPERSLCICRPCFYGTRCQFTTNGFGLSLDAILGYQIQPNINIINQPNIVKISLTLTSILVIAGFINGVLSLITFNNKIICEVGCGLYLLGSSITTLLTTILLGLKFWILVLAQMSLLKNRLFLQIQCISLDFLLRVCLNMDQWLNASVAVERTITIISATHFRKKTSRKIAKIVIIILLIFIIGTTIYDPFYRRLIDEENEDDKRIWCIATYPSSLQIFNSIIHIFHGLAPFIINLISA